MFQPSPLLRPKVPIQRPFAIKSSLAIIFAASRAIASLATRNLTSISSAAAVLHACMHASGWVPHTASSPIDRHRPPPLAPCPGDHHSWPSSPSPTSSLPLRSNARALRRLTARIWRSSPGPHIHHAFEAENCRGKHPPASRRPPVACHFTAVDKASLDSGPSTGL